MKLEKILVGIENIAAKGSLNLEIKNVESNSKKIKKNGLFVAIIGFDTDGHQYIQEAIENGAIAVMVDRNANLKSLKLPEDITVIVSQNTRKDIAKVACNFYENPSYEFNLIGITGTKGKTTTTYMIKAILEKQGLKVGLIGTIYNIIGDQIIEESSRTTPDSLELQKLFRKMADAKVDVVVMEVSSQSLKLNRVDGSHFNMVVFTNFYKDHISEKEHTDMEDYFESKQRIFSLCNKGYINADDFVTYKILNQFPNHDIQTYGIDNHCQFLAKDITVTNSSVDFKVKIDRINQRIKVGIPGRFSVYNALAAICVTLNFGVTADMIKEALLNIKVPGRSEMIENDKDLTIMIDYAHTPESLENILTAVKTYTRGKVISVFGCGGDRDKSKRSLMGEASGKIADYTIITSDNPRTEAPMEIINQIEEGMKKTNGKYTCIEKRKEAIQEAILMARRPDIVVLAGKGHETYQEINGKKYRFDEREIVKEILKNLDELRKQKESKKTKKGKKKSSKKMKETKSPKKNSEETEGEK